MGDEVAVEPQVAGRAGIAQAVSNGVLLFGRQRPIGARIRVIY